MTSLSLRVLFTVFSALAGAHQTAGAADTAAPGATTPRNIILMIGDGMGFGQVSAYRQYQDDPTTPALEPTVFDDLLVGTLATRPSDGGDSITDSAAGATAYACGLKTRNGAIGVDADGKPCLTVLELARQRGKRTGIVVSSQLTHATPAAFYAHAASRKQIAEIAGQFLLPSGAPATDLALGGGAEDFSAEQRLQLNKAGVTIVASWPEVLSAKRLPLFGTFAAAGLPMAIDRPAGQPSLAQLTAQALPLLGDREQGFFLLIEGSQIDWASHANDIVGTLSEMQDFADAVAVAQRYAAAHPDTLLVITADHETGGLSLGRDKKYEWKKSLIKQIRASAAGMAQRVLAGAAPVAVLQQWSPIVADADDSKRLNEAERTEARLEEAFADVIARHSVTGWTTRGHTGADVPLYAFGPGSAQLRGHHDNHWLGQQLLQLVAANPPSRTAKEHRP